MGFGIVEHHRCFVKWIYLVHEMKAKKKKRKKEVSNIKLVD
jgi:hypothetical protein